jgi:hypothetical protein
MSDAFDYFRAYAVRALCKARAMPFGGGKRMQRAIARIYHLLTKEAALGPNLDHLADFRTAQRLEQKIQDGAQRTSPRSFASDPR